jgi:hypothetical protein
VIYFITKAKALTLAYALLVGEPALCPNQIEGLDDEELNCEIVGMAANVVILKEVSK